MGYPKKVNGKKCANNIIDAMATWNVLSISMNRMNPEVTEENIDHMAGIAISLIVCKDALLNLAEEFELNAEYSEKEDIILLNGKICEPVLEG